MDDQEQKIEKLKEYFAQRDDVMFAFLFGSRAKGYARRNSDWDIGIYLTEENRAREQEIWGEVERITDSETDLVVLNRAAATVTWSALRSGSMLAMKDRKKYLDLMFSASDEANAWYDTSHRYFQIFECSHSLSPEGTGEIYPHHSTAVSKTD